MSLKKISNFIEGNIKYYLEKIKESPPHLQEQRLYRLYTCKDDCLIQQECKLCGCPVKKKIFTVESCGNTNIPDLMSGTEWDKYKKDNNIDIEKIKEYFKTNGYVQ